MQHNPDKHRRRSIRLKGYDYSQAGAYFVTICDWQRECLFGDIVDGEVRLNEYGRIVEKEWSRTSTIRPNIEIDIFVVMPNHFHGILVINGVGDSCRGVLQYAPTERTFRSPSQTVGAIIRGFKSTLAKKINQIRDTPGHPVWQRNYYEHVIPNEEDLNRIRQYVTENPMKWSEDENNPLNIIHGRGNS